MGNDTLAQFRRDFEERARAADALATAKDLRRQQADAESQTRAEEVVRLIEAIATTLTRPPLPYVKFRVLHRFGSQRGTTPIASWSGEIEWTGIGRRRTLRLEVDQGVGKFRWYWGSGDDHQAEETVAIASVSEDFVKDIIASITDEETFDAGRFPVVLIRRGAGSE